MNANRAVFFDRDDTLIHNVPYNGDPAKVQLVPHARECLEKLRAAGFQLFVVSNQSGVGRGIITKKHVQAVNDAMLQQLGEAFFQKIYLCYAAPEDPYAERRKPSPQMLFEAQQEFDLDLARSFMVGDRLADVACARNAGCRSVLILAQDRDEIAEAKANADFAACNLVEATQWILKQS